MKHKMLIRWNPLPEEEEDIFDVLEFVRNDVEERTCVYRRMGWMCDETGQVNMEQIR